MSTYLVIWEIEEEAASPREAAEKARRTQQDPDNIAGYFRVLDRGTNVEYLVDLDEKPEEEE